MASKRSKRASLDETALASSAAAGEPQGEQRGIRRKRSSLSEEIDPKQRDEEAPLEKRRKEEALSVPIKASTEPSESPATNGEKEATEPSNGTKSEDGAHRSPDTPVRVYADGIYDLFHFGHARSLEQAKKLFPNTYLLVGVCNDELTHRLKGKTVMTGQERAESLRHCKWVDEVVEDAPWIVTQDFMDKHQIDFVAHGEDIILENGVDIYKFVKDQGKYKVIKRTDGISTSDIILRIVKDYDSYVRRNLARGYTGKQMNISFVKEKQIQMEQNIKKFKQQMKDRYDKVQNWSKSHRIVEFMKKFGNRVEKLLPPHDELSDDDLTGFTSPDRLSSPEQYTEEEQPPHV